MASLQAKISWERTRKIEKKKKNRSDEFLHERNRKFQKKSKKIKKIRKHYYGFFSSQNMLGKAEKERK